MPRTDNAAHAHEHSTAINQTVSTLRFFFRVALKRHEIVEHTHVIHGPLIHEPRKLPVVLSVEEAARADLPLEAFQLTILCKQN